VFGRGYFLRVNTILILPYEFWKSHNVQIISHNVLNSSFQHVELFLFSPTLRDTSFTNVGREDSPLNKALLATKGVCLIVNQNKDQERPF
jgi:hypothetical protein